MYTLGTAKHRLGYAYVLRGDLVHALQPLHECMEVSERVDLPVLLVHLGSCLGQAYCLAGQPGEAVALFERARMGEEAGENMLWMPLNLVTLANALTQLGRSSDAVQTAAKALDCSRRFGQAVSEAWAYLALGAALTRCGPDYQARAAEAYQAALILGIELAMRPLVARCHLGISTTLESDRIEQRRHLETATEMFQDMEMPFWLETAASALNAL